MNEPIESEPSVGVTIADHNLLFGVLAVQSDLIAPQEFMDACTLWASRKTMPLSEVLVQQGSITQEDRQFVQSLLDRRVKKQAGGTSGESSKTMDTSSGGNTISRAPSKERIILKAVHSSGGIGQVWVAHDELLGREIALKELLPDKAGNSLNQQRFLREVQITAQLTHPGTVPVYDYVDTGDRRYYTMKFVRGQTLTDVIADYHSRRRDGGKPALSDFIALLQAFESICNTIAFAHARGILHRDLKTENVMVGDFGEVVVLDWGLAKRVDSTEDSARTYVPGKSDSEVGSQTVQGEMLGTPAYMAPEQATGNIADIDFRTDIYGLAAILYEILTGQPPFAGANVVEILHKVTSDLPVSPRELNADVSAELEAICLQGLAKNRSDRQQQAVTIGHQVRDWLAHQAQRKRSEQERERFFALSVDLLVIVDQQGNYRRVNPAVEKTLGWSMDELLGMTAAELCHEEDRDSCAAAMKRVFAGESIPEYVVRNRCRDGSHRWVAWSATRIPGEDQLYAVGRDITDRKRSEDKFQALLESAPDAMVVVDTNRRIQLVNSQTEKIFGYERAELLGKEIELLVPERFRAGHPAKFESFAVRPNARPMGSALKLFGRRKDGTEFPVEISLSPVETETGLLISSAIRDISDRLKSEAKFQALLESAPDAMVVVDRERRIQYVNAQTERLFGYTRSALLGQEVETLIPERFRLEHPQKFSEFVGDAQVRPMGTGLQLFGRRHDGSEFPIEISLSPVETEDGLLISSAIRDVSKW